MIRFTHQSVLPLLFWGIAGLGVLAAVWFKHVQHAGAEEGRQPQPEVLHSPVGPQARLTGVIRVASKPDVPVRLPAVQAGTPRAVITGIASVPASPPADEVADEQTVASRAESDEASRNELKLSAANPSQMAKLIHLPTVEDSEEGRYQADENGGQEVAKSEKKSVQTAVAQNAKSDKKADVKRELQQLDFGQITKGIGSGQIFAERPAVTLGLADILAQALTHSKSIQVLNFQPAIELQAVNEEFGRFDWRSFVDSQFNQDNQPVGDSLQISGTTIGQVRNDNNEIFYGLRKDTQLGGRIEIGESIGTRDSNSGLLTPPDQGNASLRVTFAQELLRDGGRDVVLSRALVARLNADQSLANTHADISNLLRDVLNSYWGLYRARGNYFIQLSLIKWAEDTLRILESRSKIDAQENSIEQARALLLEARADLENAKAEVLIAQDVIYRLVNSRALDSNLIEIQTKENPQQILPLGLPQELSVALQNRPEIVARLSEIHQASLEHHVSLNQLLPRLTLSLESSLNALDGNLDVFGAKSDLFDINPSYQVGVNFEYFFRNRTARAQNKRAQLTLRRLQVEYEDQIEEIRLDVSRAIRTLNASNEILRQRKETLQARQKEIAFLRVRRGVVPQEGASSSLLLEQIFQAINRLVLSQQAYIDVLSEQQSAHAELMRAKGLLISVSQVPSDVHAAVPSLRNARLERKANKHEIADEAEQRVVLPGIANPLPTRY